ncbi:MAG: hypothetical protein AAGF56_08200 [Pseudomonadota bacterium]
MIDATPDQFLKLTQAIIGTEEPFMTELGPMIIAAVSLSVARDTRSFARKFEAPHALVLRECAHLHDTLELLDRDDRNDRSGRVFLTLSEKAKQIIERTQ